MGDTIFDRLVQTVQDLPLAEAIAKTLQPVIKNVFTSAPAAMAAKDVLQGRKWIGHALHPILTDIPIGAWMMAAVFDAIDGKNADSDAARLSDLCIGIGLISAVPTVLTGLTDWSATTGRASRIGVSHAASNAIATLLYGLSLSKRRTDRRRRVLLAHGGFGAMLLGGFFGGHLVFTEGAGVHRSERWPDDASTRQADQQSQGALVELS